MKRLVVVPFLLCCISACGGDDGTSPAAFDPQDFVGTWTISISAQAGCWGAGTLWFKIDQDDADLANEEFMNVVADWQFGSLSGNINFLHETFELNFWKTFPAGGLFSGSSVSANRLEGTFADKNGGFALDPSCSSSAVATK